MVIIFIFLLIKKTCFKFIQVWKDVNGVLTCDPTIHPCAKPVPYLTFEEAAELAYFGAQVIFVEFLASLFGYIGH